MQSVVWLKERIVTSIALLAAEKYPLETGGALVGYLSNESEIVLTDLIGPGPNAVHHRTWFRPDHDHHVSEIARLYDQSGGVLVYLGDWHTHPNTRTPLMSWKDRRTLARIAIAKEARMPRPIMLIAAGEHKDWRLRIWRGEHNALWNLIGLIECAECERRT